MAIDELPYEDDVEIVCPGRTGDVGGHGWQLQPHGGWGGSQDSEETQQNDRLARTEWKPAYQGGSGKGCDSLP